MKYLYKQLLIIAFVAISGSQLAWGSTEDLFTPEKRFGHVANFVAENFEDENVDRELVLSLWKDVEVSLIEGMLKSNVNIGSVDAEKYGDSDKRLTQAQFIINKGEQGKKLWEMIFEPKFMAILNKPCEIKIQEPTISNYPPLTSFSNDMKEEVITNSPTIVIEEDVKENVVSEFNFTTFYQEESLKSQFKKTFVQCYNEFENPNNGKSKSIGVKYLNKVFNVRVYSLIEWQNAFPDDNAYRHVAGRMNELLIGNYSWKVSEWNNSNSLQTNYKGGDVKNLLSSFF